MTALHDLPLPAPTSMCVIGDLARNAGKDHPHGTFLCQWDSTYAEHCWLPVLGPGTFLLGKRLDALATVGGTLVNMDELSAALGLPNYNPRRPSCGLLRSLRRLLAYRMATFDRWQVRPVAVLPAVQNLNRLPPAALALHHTLTVRVA